MKETPFLNEREKKMLRISELDLAAFCVSRPWRGEREKEFPLLPSIPLCKLLINVPKFCAKREKNRI